LEPGHSQITACCTKSGEHGYTLVELLIVLAIIGILVAIALPNYRNSLRRAREVVLQHNLEQMRELLDQYKTDKGEYPPSLGQLVTTGYLRKMPLDTITKRSDTWEEIREELGPDAGPSAKAGVFDVKSGAQGVTLDGVPYHEL